jgi:hypothetical protein
MNIEEAIHRLSKDAAAHGESVTVREAAAKTGGVPVYSDMGGTLVLSATGEVLHYDPETRNAKVVSDPRWRKAAMKKAASRFPELIELAPTRPHDATQCAACNGQGVLLGSVDCAACMGVGWIEHSQLDENLRQLFAFTAGQPGQPPMPASILIAELKPEEFEGGRPRLREVNLRTPQEYAARFNELLCMGFAWLNVNYCGVLRGHGLVLIDYRRSPAQRKGPTSVNYSGPPKLVADAEWDALAYVVLA